MSIRFGLFSDLHSSLPHAPQRGASARTLEDLKEGLSRFAQQGVDFAVSLGDNLQPASDVSEQFEQFRSMIRLWGGYGFPVHAVMGNHEFSQLSHAQVLELFQTDRTYYSFTLGGVRFVLLDTCYNPDGGHFSEDNFDWRYGIVPEAELAWLRELLGEKRRTFVFTHGNLYFDEDDPYAAWYRILNCEEIRALLETSGCVEAVFQGHHHTFADAVCGGIRYVNVPSPERSEAYTESDFPVVTVTEDGFLYDGRRLP